MQLMHTNHDFNWDRVMPQTKSGLWHCLSKVKHGQLAGFLNKSQCQALPAQPADSMLKKQGKVMKYLQSSDSVQKDNGTTTNLQSH